jgi:glycosyltransferase involved in cell wall biosynthesis/predicted metal-dependent phosphoesterase TrpH
MAGRSMDRASDREPPSGAVPPGADAAASLAHDSGVFPWSHGEVVTRLDAHCHSRASSGPAVKALGYIGCPESYSEPERVYAQAKARGMDLVALTDHDTIDGAMELVRRGFQGVVVGEEVTTHFPEDRCKLHVLVWTLTPELHEEIGREGLRDDVYQLAAWLHERQLPHALAHPLYIQNTKLTGWHLDRCALLFKGFETLNGAHSGTHTAALDAYLSNLTPARVLALINEAGFEPRWPRVWEKARTGGSDDHGLLNVGRTWTQVRGVDKVVCGRQFFREVMAGRCEVGGVAGHSSLLAHQLTTVGAHYAAARLLPRAGALTRYAAGSALRLVGVRVARPAKWRAGLAYVKARLARRVLKKRRRLDPLLGALATHAGPVLAKYPDLLARMRAFDCAETVRPEAARECEGGWGARDSAGSRRRAMQADGSAASEHEQFAKFADELYAAVHGALSDGAVRAIKAKDGRSIADHLASYLVLEATQAPYVFSLFHQNKERSFVERITHESSAVGSGKSVLERPLRVMLFTDTLGDVNGVSRFIRNVAEQARRTGRDLTVVTSTRFDVPAAANIVNMPPVFAMKMPKYEQLEIALPPLVRMLRLADELQPDVIHCSTPGPVGTAGLIASKMLRVPVVGVYHTDFPAYVDHLFNDESMTWATTRSMRAFYGGFRAIFTRSDDYVQGLLRLGVARERILSLRPGIMIDQFHPRFTTPGLFERLENQRVLGPSRDASGDASRDASGSGDTQATRGGDGVVRVVYAGRVSVEKNLPALVDVWKAADAILMQRGVRAELVVVGDGPYRADMERALRATRARFLGFRHGEELARIYASCDLFAFPSLTDTLGQVVMESQASGMPVLVADQGGPKEVVRDGATGFVLPTVASGGAEPALDQRQWVERIVALVCDERTRVRMGEAAHQSMQSYSMDASFEHYWRVHEAAWRERLLARGLSPKGAAQERPDLAALVERLAMAQEREDHARGLANGAAGAHANGHAGAHANGHANSHARGHESDAPVVHAGVRAATPVDAAAMVDADPRTRAGM